MQQILYTIAIWAVPVLFAITLHEAAHGWVANKLGDPTARQLGRITMNPFKHIDPVGTIVVPLVLVMLSGFIIGWAKPVPVDMRHFKQPLLDMGLVALAGPASNFLMACGWALMITLSTSALADTSIANYLLHMGKAGITINLILMVLNLMPIPPLDGSKVLFGLLPYHLRYIQDFIPIIVPLCTPVSVEVNFDLTGSTFFRGDHDHPVGAL